MSMGIPSIHAAHDAGMKAKLDARLRELQTETNALKRTTELIALARAYMRLHYFLESSAVIKKADESLGKVTDLEYKRRLRIEINDLNANRRNAFARYMRTDH